jgi:hypothetical protein
MRCSMRGDTSSDFGPNTGTICRFSVRTGYDSAAQWFGQRRIDHDFRRSLRLSSLSVGVGRPENGYRYDKAEKCLALANHGGKDNGALPVTHAARRPAAGIENEGANL